MAPPAYTARAACTPCQVLLPKPRSSVLLHSGPTVLSVLGGMWPRRLSVCPAPMLSSNSALSPLLPGPSRVSARTLQDAREEDDELRDGALRWSGRAGAAVKIKLCCSAVAPDGVDPNVGLAKCGSANALCVHLTDGVVVCKNAVGVISPSRLCSPYLCAWTLYMCFFLSFLESLLRLEATSRFCEHSFGVMYVASHGAR